jgi:sugar-specific transcriptional regulator TrmB
LTDDELAKALQTLGFTEHEARAYLTLDEAAAKTAYEVARLSGLPKSNCYDVLRSLSLKGAIQTVSQEPSKYVRVQPADFFGRQMRQVTNLCDTVTKTLKTRTKKVANVYVWTFKGEKQVRAKIDAIISEAKRHIWIKAPVRLLDAHLPALKAAARRGIQVILIVFGKQHQGLAVHKGIQVFLHEGTGTNRGASDVMFTMSCDSSSIMIAAFSVEASASFSQNRSIVYTVETLILHEFYLAEMYARIGSLLDETFGKHLGKLRAKYRPRDMGQSLLG